MQTYPADAAGVRLESGVILSGDDTPKFRAAGFECWRCHVSCSAKIAAGEYTAPRRATVTVAIDLNGATLAEVARIAGAMCPALAIGIYGGGTHRALVGVLPTAGIAAAHERLLAELPGFGCFAVLT